MHPSRYFIRTKCHKFKPKLNIFPQKPAPALKVSISEKGTVISPAAQGRTGILASSLSFTSNSLFKICQFCRQDFLTLVLLKQSYFKTPSFLNQTIIISCSHCLQLCLVQNILDATDTLLWALKMWGLNELVHVKSVESSWHAVITHLLLTFLHVFKFKSDPIILLIWTPSILPNSQSLKLLAPKTRNPQVPAWTHLFSCAFTVPPHTPSSPGSVSNL